MIPPSRRTLITLLFLFAPLALTGSSRAQASDGTWTSVPLPSARADHAAIFDPVRHRMLVFGGIGQGGVGLPNDLWELSESGTWTQLDVTIPPSLSLSPSSAIYDPLRDRILVIGFQGTPPPGSGAVWQLPLSGPPAWSVLAASGTMPLPGAGHNAVYDPWNDRMIVFGTGDMNALSALSLSGTPTWTALTPLGSPPPTRKYHSTVLDFAHGRMLVFGGLGANNVIYNDVWALSLTGGTPTWSQVATMGQAPSARFNHDAIYDSAHDRMIVDGGQDFSQPAYDCMQLSLSSATPVWSQVQTYPAEYRTRETAVFDSTDQRMIVFGGYTFNEGSSGPYLNDAWQLSLSGTPSWSPLAATPPPTSGQASIYDGTRDRILVFNSTNVLSETPPVLGLWELTLSGDPRWNQISLPGDYPALTGPAAAVYDPLRDRMLLLGGTYAPAGLTVWQVPFSGAPAWSSLSPLGTPPAYRDDQTAIYDPVGDRVIVFGGHYGLTDYDETWALDLSGTASWNQLFPSNTPPSARHAHSAIYDSVRHRMVIFGGYNGSTALNDVWALTLDGSPAWNPVTPAGSPPAARGDHTAIYDSVRDRMVVLGGTTGAGPSSDVWELAFAGTPAWNQLTPSGTLSAPRSGHSSLYDALRDRMIVWGGAWTNDVSFLSWGDLVAAPPPGLPAEVRLAGFPNPFRSKVDVHYSIPTESRVSVRVFDTAGRELAILADGAHPAANYHKSWDGRDRSGKQVAPGIYFIQLRAPGRTESVRVVHIE